MILEDIPAPLITKWPPNLRHNNHMPSPNACLITFKRQLRESLNPILIYLPSASGYQFQKAWNGLSEAPISNPTIRPPIEQALTADIKIAFFSNASLASKDINEKKNRVKSKIGPT
jgi:hypothetical protein